MADVVVFHHAQGLTGGVRAFARELTGAGHRVSVPDLYDGRTFDTLEDGVAHAQQVGFGALLESGAAAGRESPEGSVYVGFSLGVMPAQMLAQTRAGAGGAVLCHACVPVSEFGAAWPDDVPVQVHAMADDAMFVDDGDAEAARALVAQAADAELVLYPGDAHLFADRTLDGYDADAAQELTQRVLHFLERVG